MIVMRIAHHRITCIDALSAHLREAGRAPLAACAAMSARIAPLRTIKPPEWRMRSTMINAIGALHTAVHGKKRPEDDVQVRAEVKKRRPKPKDDIEDRERPRAERSERGLRA